jgi:hypothetical protein
MSPAFLYRVEMAPALPRSTAGANRLSFFLWYRFRRRAAPRRRRLVRDPRAEGPGEADDDPIRPAGWHQFFGQWLGFWLDQYRQVDPASSYRRGEGGDARAVTPSIPGPRQRPVKEVLHANFRY